MKRKLVFTGFLAATVAATVIPTSAETLNGDERKCIQNTVRAAGKLFDARYLESSRCLRRAFRGKVLYPNECVFLDTKEKVAKARRLLLKSEEKYCPAFPSYGHLSAAGQSGHAISTAFRFFVDGPGSRLSGLVSELRRKDRSCLAAVERARHGLWKSRFKELVGFWSDEEALLSVAEYGTLGSAITSYVEEDADGKIAKASSKLLKAIEKRCSSADLDEIFRGECSERGEDLAACFEERGRCEFCQLTNAISWTDSPCDVFDDLLENDSCENFWHPYIYPDATMAPTLAEGALPAGSSGKTTFYVHTRLLGSSRLAGVTVETPTGEILGTLADDGEHPDVEFGDEVFAASLTMDGKRLAPGDCLELRSRLRAPGVELLSDFATFCATRQPRGFASWERAYLDNSSGTPVADSAGLLVRLTEEATESDLETVADRHNADIVGSDLSIGFFQLRLRTPAADLISLDLIAEALRDEEAIDSVSRDVVYESKVRFGAYAAPEFNGTPAINHEYLARIRADEAWFLTRGAGVTIAVLDSGVSQLDPFGAPIGDLGGKVEGGFCAADDGPAGNYLCLSEDVATDFHGTVVAALGASAMNGANMVGVAPASKVDPVRVFDCRLKGGTACGPTGAAILAGIKYLQTVNRPVAVLSFGPTCPSDANPEDGQAICAALASASQQTLFVASAGNENSLITAGYAPATCPGVISVGGTMKSGDEEITWVDSIGGGKCGSGEGSNFGELVDLAAPAKDLPHVLGGTVDGTSFSAPLVAGAAALLKSINPDFSPTELGQRLLASARPMPGQPFGRGFLDIFEALTNAGFERDGNLGRDWDDGGSWNAYADVPPTSVVDYVPDLPASWIFADPPNRHLAEAVREFGGIEPTSGDWMVVVRNGTFPLEASGPGGPGLPGRRTLPQGLYETGFLNINLYPWDLGEDGDLPISFDWSLIAEVEGQDVPCPGGDADCVAYSIGAPLDISVHSGGTTLLREQIGKLRQVDDQPTFLINDFPGQSCSADLPISNNSATWTGWQRVNTRLGATPFEFLAVSIVNSPLGYRGVPEFGPEGEVIPNYAEWEWNPTNFAVLVDNLAFRER